MQLELCKAKCTGDAKNVLYPDLITSSDAESFKSAVAFDHVCGIFEGNKRRVDNFKSSSLIVMDCDNESDDESKWITPEMIDEMMPDTSYVIVPSRHNMLPKDGASARPRFHVYFPIERTDNADDYVALKRAIQSEYPFFDSNALDAARFIYGSNPDEIEWHEGWVYIDEMVGDVKETEDEYQGGVIKEGTRNSTLSQFAAKAIKRYGITEKAYEIFTERAKKCDPPLDREELQDIWRSAIKFGKKVQSQDGYVSPDEYNQDFKTLKPEDYSDIGQAKVFISEYGDILRYSDSTNYLRYVDGVWIESGQRAMGALEEFLDLQLQEAKDQVEDALKAVVDLGEDAESVKAGGKKYEQGLGGNVLKAYLRYKAANTYLAFVLKRRDARYINATLNVAKPMLEIDVADLDKDEFLLNVPGATYDLRKGLDGKREASPLDLLTKQTLVAPGDKGKEIWEKALEDFFCGDKELIEYVQKTVGLSAIGKTYVEHLIIAFGRGKNGKSSFYNALSRVLGTYSGAISSDTMTYTCRRNIKPEMAELKGMRLVIAAELEEGMRLNSSVVKQICSTDEVVGEKKFMAPFHFTPSHTVVLYTNFLPKVSANDEGTWRRLIVIPFNATFEGSSDIKNYADYLVENAGPSIMSWIIEGAKKAIDSDYKFEMPKAVQDAVSSYRGDNDWLGHFLEDCCDLDKTYTQKSGELYQEYRCYCQRNGEFIRSTTDFYGALDRAGFLRHKTNKGSFVKGLTLKIEDFLE